MDKKLASATRRIRKIQAEIRQGETRPSDLLPSLTRAFDAAYKVARFLGPDADQTITDLARLTSEAVKTGEALYRDRLVARADFAANRSELQRKRIDPDSYRGEIELQKIWGK